jgi:pyruvate carboxylase
MPTYTLTLSFRSEPGATDSEESRQKPYWEDVAKELQQKGARILNVQSKVGNVGKPTATVNLVTITYKALKPIKYTGNQS